MSRYIDADALKEYIDCGHLRSPAEVCFSERDVVDLIDAQPTVDAVPVIRCKDCEDCTETKLYDGQRWNYCMRLRCVVKENDFCCWAERKYPKIKAKETE